jgi:hypothetical protein
MTGAPHIDYIHHSRSFRKFLIQRKKKQKETKVEKEKKRNRNQKKKKRKETPPSAGPNLAQPAPRAPSPLSPAQAAQLRAHVPPLTARPHQSATRLPPSRAAPSPWQLGPAYQLRRSRPCLTDAFAAERLTPRRLAIKACTGLSNHPATMPEPSPHPSPARAIPIVVSSILAIMASSSALAVPSIPLPLSGAYKRNRPSPVLTTPAPANSSAFPPSESS